MSYTKEQLIEILIPALAKSTESTNQDVRNTLETYDVRGLKRELERQVKQGLVSIQADPEHDPIRKVIRAEARRQAENDPGSIRRQQEHERKMQEMLRTYALAQIFRTQILIEGRPHLAVQNKASENIIINWLHPGETLTPVWFRSIFLENSTLANQLQWQEVLDPETKQQRLQQDRDAFSNGVCRQLQVADTEANFKLVCELVGPGLSKKLNNFDSSAFHLLQQAADSGALAPASDEEIEKWRAEAAAEDVEAHNRKLLQASPVELRTLARQEPAPRKVACRGQTSRFAFCSPHVIIIRLCS